MNKLPQLRRIHSDEILETSTARYSLDFWRRKTTKRDYRIIGCRQKQIIKS
ncbi:MAG: hypothetical protein M3Q78_12160 [Acidobacteriota bacterium]|nr:hypothetical protein [Acidobacteriota bacterium]